MIPNTRDKVASIRFTRADLRRIRRAASKLGVPLSDFVAKAALEQAAKVSRECPTCGRQHHAA